MRKFIIKFFLTEVTLIGAAFAISYIKKLKISDTLVYMGVFCLVIGMFSLVGNRNNSTDSTNFLAKSVGVKSTNEITNENYSNRNSSMRFFIFMFCVGAILLLAGALAEYFI